MKRIFVIAAVILFVTPVVASAQEAIRSFHVEITLNEDATINVVENILYDFDSENKHGIFRDIPIKYKARGGNYNLRISNITVTDEQGDFVQAQITDENDSKRIRIGDPDIYVTGEQAYVLSYTIDRAINYFNDSDELYWNVTGNEWEVSIESASVTVLLPEGVDLSKVKVDCFAGSTGSTNRCSQIPGSGSQTLRFAHPGLNAFEGMTIVAGLPKGALYEPTSTERAMDIVKDNWIVVIPLFVFLAMLYLWNSKGKDPAGRGSIVTQYEAPKGFTPSEVGTMLDERADTYDISAEIIYLAIHGYVKINRIEEKKLIFTSTDYALDKLREADNQLVPHQRMLLDKLFKQSETVQINGKNVEQVKLSDLKQKFHEDLQTIQHELFTRLTMAHYFVKNPRHVKLQYIIAGGLFGLLTIPAMAAYGFLGAASIAVSSAIIIVFGFFMPQKTKEGVLVREHILGLRRYIMAAEKERISFHNAPSKNPELFEKLLPYAMVFKAEKEWAKEFEGIYTRQPNWYGGSYGSTFTVLALTNSLSDFTTTTNSTLASTASSGGSGFSGGSSGGGFGGGGGGSW